jgi:hypothetical protein
MTPKKKRSTGRKVKNPPTQIPSPKGGNIEGQPNAQPKANDCRYVKQDPPNVYVNIPEAKWSYANKISAATAIVTFALTVFTYLLFDKAAVQAREAIRASNAADSVFAETKREFNFINEPIVQLSSDSTRLEKIMIGKPVIIDYLLVNLKGIATKVISSKSLFGFESHPPNLDSLKANMLDTINNILPNVNRFITKESPLPGFGTANEPMTSDLLFGLANGKAAMYFLHLVKFENFTTIKPKFSFMVIKFSFSPNGRAYHEVVRNEID